MMAFFFGGPDDQRFTVWKTIHEEDEKYMGMWWKTTENGICIHTDEYTSNLELTGISKKDDLDRDLSTEELAVYRSSLAKARWPVKRVVLELACGVGALAQHNTNEVGDVRVHHAMQLDMLIRRAEEIKNQGGAKLRVQKLNLEEP